MVLDGKIKTYIRTTYGQTMQLFKMRYMGYVSIEQ